MNKLAEDILTKNRWGNMIANFSVVYEQTVCSVGKSGSSVQLWNNIQIGFNPALCGLVVLIGSGVFCSEGEFKRACLPSNSTSWRHSDSKN